MNESYDRPIVLRGAEVRQCEGALGFIGGPMSPLELEPEGGVVKVEVRTSGILSALGEGGRPRYILELGSSWTFVWTRL